MPSFAPRLRAVRIAGYQSLEKIQSLNSLFPLHELDFRHVELEQPASRSE